MRGSSVIINWQRDLFKPSQDLLYILEIKLLSKATKVGKCSQVIVTAPPQTWDFETSFHILKRNSETNVWSKAVIGGHFSRLQTQLRNCAEQ